MDRYTLCLIRHADSFLLVNRQKRPAMGMWNGVGGKIEPARHRKLLSSARRSKRPASR
nr:MULTISPECIES: hypothetical protein [unclassified Exiguobacterium]